MKKLIPLILTLLFLASCSKAFQTDKEYEYSNLSFNISKNLKDTDLASFYPMGVSSIKGLKQNITEHIDTYHIVRTTADGQERLYFNNTVKSINFSETQCSITDYDDTVSLYYSNQTDNIFLITDESGETVYTFYYKNSKLYYSIELTPGFEIIHNFK